MAHFFFFFFAFTFGLFTKLHNNHFRSRSLQRFVGLQQLCTCVVLMTRNTKVNKMCPWLEVLLLCKFVVCLPDTWGSDLSPLGRAPGSPLLKATQHMEHRFICHLWLPPSPPSSSWLSYLPSILVLLQVGMLFYSFPIKLYRCMYVCSMCVCVYVCSMYVCM